MAEGEILQLFSTRLIKGSSSLVSNPLFCGAKNDETHSRCRRNVWECTTSTESNSINWLRERPESSELSCHIQEDDPASELDLVNDFEDLMEESEDFSADSIDESPK
ncbi:unnamed protein product [Protopolystoma xenopodis]|uniref:Uncharacterized protein n=1 Tax=Protopolystoma xenopodis TaxID=117903 RepID=A0A3S4ZH99_9PLAT|nr:unnamed protein product [Protopolystoma xenopodis]